MATRTTRTTRTSKVTKQEDNGLEKTAEDTADGQDAPVETVSENGTEKKANAAPAKNGNDRKADAAPATAGGILILAELKEMSISELTHVAKEMDVEGASGMRKAGIDFQSARRANRKKRFDLFAKAFWKLCPTASVFCARPNIIICPVPTIFTFRPSQIRKFDLRTGDTVSADRFVRRKKANAISR